MSLLCAVTHRTEDAVRKWCPFAWTRNNCSGERVSFRNEDSTNQGKCKCNNGEVIDGWCLTSRCMAWIDETDYFHGVTLGRCGLINLSKP
jgi:hypothetical protein